MSGHCGGSVRISGRTRNGSGSSRVGDAVDRRPARDPAHREGRHRRPDPRREQARARAAPRARGRARPVRAQPHVPAPVDAREGRDERRDRVARRLLRTPPTPGGRVPRPMAVGPVALARELRHLADPSLRRVRCDLPPHHHRGGDRDLRAPPEPRRAARSAHDRHRDSRCWCCVAGSNARTTSSCATSRTRPAISRPCSRKPRVASAS